MKNFLGLRKISVRELCILAMLTALTVILAIFCTLRIGETIKIPLKFITVFITASVFGPIWGGVVGAIGDILNSILVPIGAPLPQITAVEFLYGFLFGLFFYNRKNYYINTIICSLIITLIDIILVSFILTSVGYFLDFTVAIAIRLPASLFKFVIHTSVILFLKKYLNYLGRLIKR